MKPSFLFLYILFFLAFSLEGQNPARTGKDYAYFFYVTNFDDRGWEKLPETETEVKTIANELEANYGFKTELFGNLGKQEILEKIRVLNQRKYGKDDQVLFFFSTHGNYQSTTERGFLIPKDGKATDPYGTSWISYDDLGSYITLNNCSHVLLALDACYSGSFGDRWKGPPNEKPWDGDSDCATKAMQALKWGSRLYFSSGSREQRTPAQSKFASRWLEALRQGAEDGVVRIKDLRYYLSAIEYPAPEGGTFSNRHEEGGNFVFMHNDACLHKTTPTPNNDQAHWLSIQSDFTTENLQRHLELFPDCQHQSVLNSLGIGSMEIPADDAVVLGDPSTSEIIGSKPVDLPDMVFVKGGTFQMGSTEGDDDEKPIHSVTLSDFYLHKNEVTFEEYDAFCEATKKEKPDDEGWGRGRLPVINVDWYDAIEYCNWRSKKDGLRKVYTINKSKKDPTNIGTSKVQYKNWMVTANWKANGYRLPTEAEWEYAARDKGGTDKWAGTSNENNLFRYANNPKNIENNGYNIPVGSLLPNTLGLFDMSGNASELCWDWYDRKFYNESPPDNPLGPESGTIRVVRSNWGNNPNMTYCTARFWIRPDFKIPYIGFRLARSAQ